MKEFSYVIKDAVGIHARPAGLLVNEVKSLAPTKVYLSKAGKKVDAERLFSVLSLGVKQGEEVLVTVEGKNEDKAAAKLEEFFKNNL